MPSEVLPRPNRSSMRPKSFPFRSAMIRSLRLFCRAQPQTARHRFHNADRRLQNQLSPLLPNPWPGSFDQDAAEAVTGRRIHRWTTALRPAKPGLCICTNASNRPCDLTVPSGDESAHRPASSNYPRTSCTLWVAPSSTSRISISRLTVRIFPSSLSARVPPQTPSGFSTTISYRAEP